MYGRDAAGRVCAGWNRAWSRWTVRALLLVATMAISAGRASAASDVVLYSSDFATIHGNWAGVATSGAAGGQAMTSADYGWSTPDAPTASPADYVEATFSAPAGTPFHVWMRLRASADSKYNDSVWAQWSDALDSSARAVYRSDRRAASS